MTNTYYPSRRPMFHPIEGFDQPALFGPTRTGHRVASIAGRVLSDPTASAEMKALAGSALRQRRKHM